MNMSDLSKLSIEGIDIEAAITNSGSQENLKEMLCQFYLSIDENSSLIETYFNDIEIKLSDFRIKVHSLKSTARLIGALELSQKAKDLEVAADNKDINYIKQYTPNLLSSYRSYKNYIKAFAPNIKENNDNKISIEKNKFLELLSSLENFINDYDLDNLEKIQKELINYELPLDFSPICDKISKCIYNVDFEGLFSLLADIKEFKERF